MGIVTDYIRTMVARQVSEQRLLLWLDSERHYGELVDQLGLDDTIVVRYHDSFFALRHTIDVQLSGDHPPRMLVYVPRDDDMTLDALAEVGAFAALLRPGQPVAARNTRLSVIAQRQ